MILVGDPATGMMRPADDPGWSSYKETILVVHGRSPREVALDQPIGAREQAAFQAAGLTGCFGLVTPDNPFGRALPAAENAERRRGFDAELAAIGALVIRVDGLSPDRLHREVGVALRWPLEAVRQLARRWEQSAIYWFDGHAMWVVGALTVSPPWKLVPQ
jgi:hypothetical protein